MHQMNSHYFQNSSSSRRAEEMNFGRLTRSQSTNHQLTPADAEQRINYRRDSLDRQPLMPRSPFSNHCVRSDEAPKPPPSRRQSLQPLSRSSSRPTLKHLHGDSNRSGLRRLSRTSSRQALEPLSRTSSRQELKPVTRNSSRQALQPSTRTSSRQTPPLTRTLSEKKCFPIMRSLSGTINRLKRPSIKRTSGLRRTDGSELNLSSRKLGKGTVQSTRTTQADDDESPKTPGSVFTESFRPPEFIVFLKRPQSDMKDDFWGFNNESVDSIGLCAPKTLVPLPWRDPQPDECLSLAESDCSSVTMNDIIEHVFLEL